VSHPHAASRETHSQHESSQHERTSTARLRGRQGRNLWFGLFIAPFLIGLIVFVYVPIGWSAVLSFFDARATLHPTTFVGWRNYQYLLTDPLFRDSLLVFTVFATYLFRASLMEFPQELEEAALLDGANPWTTMWRIVVPNCLGIIAAVSTITFICAWYAFRGHCWWPVTARTPYS